MGSTEVDECEIFINEIKIRPQLWDKYNSDFNNRSVTDAKWLEMSTKFGVPTENVKKKWNMLRIQFRRELRKQISHRIANADSTFPTIQPWKYFIPMLFMKNQVNFVKPISSASDRSLKIDWEDKNADFDQILCELQGLESTYQQPSYDDIPNNPSLVKTPKPSLTINMGDNLQYNRLIGNDNSIPLTVLLENFQKEIMILEREKIQKTSLSNKDDDVLFLHSILPYFKALDPKQKFILRTKIQELVCNFIMSDDSIADHSYATTSKQ